MRKPNSSTGQPPQIGSDSEWKKKAQTAIGKSYWTTSFYPGDHSRNHCRASAPLLAGLLKTHTARMKKLKRCAMPSASLVTEEMLQGRDWKKMNALWRSAGPSVRLQQTWQPARERYKLCGNGYSCYGMSHTSRVRLEVKESRDVSRRREWTLRHEIEMMWLSVQLEMGQ